MEIRVNGEERDVPAELSVAEYVVSLGFDPDTVVVELDREVLKRAEYDERRLTNNCKLELIRFIGGG